VEVTYSRAGSFADYARKADAPQLMLAAFAPSTTMNSELQMALMKPQCSSHALKPS